MKAKQQRTDSVTVINAYAPTYSAEDKKVNNFMMILKKHWLIVTQNIRSLQVILMPKLE